MTNQYINCILLFMRREDRISSWVYYTTGRTRWGPVGTENESVRDKYLGRTGHGGGGTAVHPIASRYIRIYRLMTINLCLYKSTLVVAFRLLKSNLENTQIQKKNKVSKLGVFFGERGNISNKRNFRYCYTTRIYTYVYLYSTAGFEVVN